MKKFTKTALIISALLAVTAVVLVIVLTGGKTAETPDATPTAVSEPTSEPTKLPPVYFTPSPTPDPVGNVFPLKYDWLNRSRLDLMTEYPDMSIYDYTALDEYIGNDPLPVSGIYPLKYRPVVSGDPEKINPCVYDVLGILPPQFCTDEFRLMGITAVDDMSVPYISPIESDYYYIQSGGSSYAVPGINRYSLVYACDDNPEISVQNMLAGFRLLIRNYQAEHRIPTIPEYYMPFREVRSKFLSEELGAETITFTGWLERYVYSTVEEAMKDNFLVDLGIYHDMLEVEAATVVLFSGQYDAFVDKAARLHPEDERNYIVDRNLIKDKLDSLMSYYCEMLDVDKDYFKVFLPLYWEMKGYGFEIEDLNDTFNSAFNKVVIDDYDIMEILVAD